MLGLGKEDGFKKIKPRKWKVQHTKEWLKDFRNQFESDIQLDFNPSLICNGELLITFSIEVFKEISPLFGRLLYESLHFLINNHNENDKSNKLNENKLFNDKVLNNCLINYKKYKREGQSWYPKDPLFMRTSQSRLQFNNNGCKNDLIFIQNREITLQFKQFLLNEINKKGKNVYLQGIPGIGKSHTIYQIVCELREDLDINENECNNNNNNNKNNNNNNNNITNVNSKNNNDMVMIDLIKSQPLPISQLQQSSYLSNNDSISPLSILTAKPIKSKNRVAYIPDYGVWFGFGIEESIHLFIYSLLVAYELKDDKFVSDWWSFIKKSTQIQQTREYTQYNVIKFLKELEQYNIENQLNLFIFLDQHSSVPQQSQILSKFPWNLPQTLSSIFSTSGLIVFTSSENCNEHFTNFLKKNNNNWSIFTMNTGFSLNEFKLWKETMKCKALESNEINAKLSYFSFNIPYELNLYLSDENKFKSPKEAFSHFYSTRIYQIGLDIQKFRSKLTIDEKSLFEKTLAIMELRLPIGSEEILTCPQYMISEYIPMSDNNCNNTMTTATTTPPPPTIKKSNIYPQSQKIKNTTMLCTTTTTTATVTKNKKLTTSPSNSLNKLLSGGYYIVRSFNPMIQNVLIKSSPSYQIIKEMLDKFTIQIFSNGFHLYNKDLCCFAAEMYLLRKIIQDRRIKIKTLFTKGKIFYPPAEIIKINNLYLYEIFEQTSLDEINPPWSNSLVIVPKTSSFKDVEFYLWDSVNSKFYICQLTIKDPDQHHDGGWQQLIHHNIWKDKLKKSGILEPKVYFLWFGPHFDNSGEYVTSFEDLSDNFPLFKFYNSIEWIKVKR